MLRLKRVSESWDQVEDLVCPECGQPLEAIRGDVAQLARCPACENEFVIPAVDGSTELAEAEEVEQPVAPESELDGLRMRQMVTARRAAIRSRTYMLLGAMLCAVGCAKLITLMVSHIGREGWSRLVIGYGIFAGLAIVGAFYCLRRAGELNKESKGSALPEPAEPPDFGPLSDGSQHVKNLEEIR